MGPPRGRRQFLGLALGVVASGCASTPSRKEAASGAEDVGPAEDLMREHGVLNRTLLVYEECRTRLHGNGSLPPGVLLDAASLVQQFVHGYHEVLEESEVFPRLEAQHRLADLTRVLREQHEVGRALTSRILALATGGYSLPDERRAELSSRLTEFIRMYRPHEAREDTVLFPTFHAMYSPEQWGELGQRFEERERAALGEKGFEKAVERVAALERALGIDDLARFTPRA